MNYRYTLLPGKVKGKKVKLPRPLVPVRLFFKHKFNKMPILALVDSGADYCYCNKILGDWLGIDFKKKKPVTSFAINNSKFTCYTENIEIMIDNFPKSKAPVQFSEKFNKAFPIVLGQKGVFDNFKITFEKYNNIFSLEPKKKK